eukprot:TRINITY_DN80464_c0_g1_i1.p1 TRINITY_DN80464_c0_g1~~TRINITY_DN80464_c0_g1_i1.p1  ORF type:complete len:528 (-),score=156.66 TRINITY_DN80464_c0_g1_i1:11-1450(-)
MQEEEMEDDSIEPIAAAEDIEDFEDFEDLENIDEVFHGTKNEMEERIDSGEIKRVVYETESQEEIYLSQFHRLISTDKKDSFGEEEGKTEGGREGKETIYDEKDAQRYEHGLSVRRIIHDDSFDYGHARRLSWDGFGRSRREVWCRLVGFNGLEDESFLKEGESTSIDPDFIPRHPEWEQVGKDVDRSLFFIMDPQERMYWRGILGSVIHQVLSKHSETINYYQGYHDISTVILIVVGSRRFLRFLERMSLSYLRDWMDGTFEPTLHALQAMGVLLHRVDPTLMEALNRMGLGQMAFSVSWLLTWFSHDINDMSKVLRIFDICLAHHPITIAYISVAMIHMSRETLFKCTKEDDFGETYAILRSLPKSHSIDFEATLSLARRMMEALDPAKFSWQCRGFILENSCLRCYPFWFHRDVFGMEMRIFDADDDNDMNQPVILHKRSRRIWNHLKRHIRHYGLIAAYIAVSTLALWQNASDVG